MSTSTSADNIDPADAAAHLEAGRLGRTALVSLSLSAFYPAVSLALVPFLVFTTAGVTAWQSSLLATLAVVYIGRAVIVFARRYVATGSLYSYIAEVFGPWARYLTGAALLGGYITVVTGAVAFVGVFVGSFLYSRGLTTALQFGPQAVIFAITLAGAAAIALRGLGTSVRIAVVLAVLALPLVVVITVASAHHTGLDLAHQFVFDFSLSHTMQGIAVGAALLIGFESCAVLATETRDPLRNVPVAVMAAPVVLGGLLPIVTILQVPGLAAASDQLAAGMSAPAALAIQSGLGTSVATATDLVLAVASFASLIGFVNYAARFALALAEDGLLPDAIAHVHPRYHSPYVAIGALAVTGFAMGSGLVFWTGDIVSAYTPIATLIVYLWVLPYVLIAAGAIVLTVRAREFRPGLWIAAAIGAAAMAWSYLNGLINPPAPPAGSMAWVAVVVIAALVVAFTANQRWRTRQSQHERTDRTTSTGPTRVMNA